MISIDYKISRDEGDENKEYYPSPVMKAIPNVSLVQGANSSGKSTILNLIGIAMNGIESDSISESLKQKMRSFVDESYQKVRFDIKMGIGNEILEISKAEDSGSKCKYQYIKGEQKTLLTQKELKQSFNLIYDIPEDPTQRLSQLTQTIDGSQRDLIGRVQNFRENLRLELKDLNTSRDENAIQQQKCKVDSRKKELADMEIQVGLRTEAYKILSQYTYLKMFQKCSHDIANTNAKIVDLEDLRKKDERNKHANRAQNNKITNKINQLLEQAGNLSYNVLEIVKNLSLIDDFSLQQWEQYRFRSAFEAGFVSPAIKEVVRKAHDELLILKNKLAGNQSKIEKNNLIESLMTQLESMQMRADALPEVKDGIKNLLQILEKEKAPIEADAKQFDAVEEAIALCWELANTVKEADNLLLEIDKTEREDAAFVVENDDDNVKNQLIAANNELAAQEKLLKEYKTKCINLQFEPDNAIQADAIFSKAKGLPNHNEIAILTIPRLQEKLKADMNRIASLNGEIQRAKELIVREEQRLQDMEQKKPHRYSGRLDEIQAIMRSCDGIIRKLQSYNGYLKDISEHKRKQNQDEAFLAYSDVVGKYLGRIIGSIAHVDKKHQIERVDLLEEKILTTEQKVIHFADMGTGQSQSAYLLSQLNNATSDPRKMIVLFDEIAMMDANSIRPIIEKMRELYLTGRLLAGIMVMAQREEGELIRVVDYTEA